MAIRINTRAFCHNAAAPLAREDVAVDPRHDATSLLLVHVKCAMIERTTCPRVETIAMPEAVLELATVNPSRERLHAKAMFLTILPVARVIAVSRLGFSQDVASVIVLVVVVVVVLFFVFV